MPCPVCDRVFPEDCSEIDLAGKKKRMQGAIYAGSHHIYIHPDIPKLVNLQNVKGNAKPYQVKQLLQLIEQYNLQMEENK